MGASNGWKCQQKKGIADERELMQLLQQHLVAGRRGTFRKMPLSTVASFPTSAQKASKKQGMQRDKQHSTASKGASGSRGSIRG